jgi:integrase
MLTDQAIRSLKSQEKPYKRADASGLYLLINPNGSRWWRLKFRVGGKEKLLSLGTYPTVTLKMARERRDAARQQLATGIDPAGHRQATKSAQAETFEAVAREWFAHYAPTKAASHTSKIIQRFERDIFPWIGTTPVARLTAPQLLPVLRRIEARGAIETAHRALQTCSQVLRYAIRTGRLERNIAGDLQGALTPVKTTHLAAVTEPQAVGQLLRAMDGYQGSFVVRCALKLAPLVFVRPGELRQAHWSDINLSTAEWRFNASKTGQPHIVPLSRQALAILADIKPLTGDGPFVFPSDRDAQRAMSDNAILSALRRMGIDKKTMTGHGFRAMARTLLDEVLGMRPEVIEHQLAHAVRDPLGRAYNRTAHLPERHKMMQTWADYLDQLRQSL